MSVRAKVGVAAMMAAVCGAWCSGGMAQVATSDSTARAGAGPATSGTVVLDTSGFWRMHQTLKPPVIRTEGGSLKPLDMKSPWVDRETAGPEANWAGAGFDDHRWLRGPARLVCATPYLARLSLRGKFNVTDLAKVQGLKLSVAYHGGVIVYVNGQELTRANVAAPSTGSGQAGAVEVADDYPAEAYLGSDGKVLPHERRGGGDSSPQLKMIQRSTDVEVPAKMLRAGVNVIAIDILRAPYPRALEEKKDPKQAWWMPSWDNCQLDRVQLTAASAEGLTPNVARPEGFQVWNSNLVACDYDLDYGDPTEKVQPVEIVAARNGVFSGKVVAGSTKPIAGLKAVAGDLKGSGGTIAASQVETRFALPWAQDDMSVGNANPYPADVTLLSCLAPQAPDVAPVSAKKPAGRRPGDTGPIVNGAVVPIWVTVRVPKDAKAALYKGEVTIQATGEKPVAVPVEVSVADYTLPDTQDYRTHVEILQSPDTLAAEYKVPLWSDKHWELIAESFRLMNDSGSRTLHIPLIAETNLGHEQTMVRWVKKGDAYEYDFSILDKYLDAAEKNSGKPKLLVLHVWDVYMLEKGQVAAGWQAERESSGQGGVFGRGPVVTTWDAGANKAQNVILPRYKEAGSEAQWKPLYEQLLQRLAKRGLDKTVMLGLMTDVLPAKEDVAFWAKIAPGVPWAVHSHAYNGGPSVYDLAKVDYRLGVWGLNDATVRSLMGWKRPNLLVRYWRPWSFNAYPTAEWRELCEMAICGDQRGVGRLGGDFWDVLRDKNGQRKGRIYSRYPQSMWRNLDVYVSLLAPGPHAPAATQHLVNLNEGVQACEARIALEKALSDPALKARLGDDLASRCQAALDERMRAMQRSFCMFYYWSEGGPAVIGSTNGPAVPGHYWYVGSDWEGRDATLFGLAGEVAKKLGRE